MDSVNVEFEENTSLLFTLLKTVFNMLFFCSCIILCLFFFGVFNFVSKHLFIAKQRNHFQMCIYFIYPFTKRVFRFVYVSVLQFYMNK